MRFSIYQESQRGGRKSNQDRMGYVYTKDALLLVLCDGMGGHLHGEVAAEITVRTIGQLFQREARTLLPNPPRFLEDAMMAAHIDIHRYRAEHGLSESPRTTCVAAVFQEGKAWWAHAGDSRLYWLRDGAIFDVTRDHSQLMAMIADGLIDADDVSAAANSPDRNRLFSCIGAPAMPLIELSDPVKLKPGDHFLLCSDGLWGVLQDTDIVEAFHRGTVMEIVPQLIHRALAEAGSRSDNVTAIGMTWEDDVVGLTTGLLASLMEEATHHEFKTTTPPSSSDVHDNERMTEDSIESAIAEIKQAIAKTQHVLNGSRER